MSRIDPTLPLEALLARMDHNRAEMVRLLVKLERLPADDAEAALLTAEALMDRAQAELHAAEAAFRDEAATWADRAYDNTEGST